MLSSSRTWLSGKKKECSFLLIQLSSTTQRPSVNTWRTQDLESVRRRGFGSDTRRVKMKKRLSSIRQSDPRRQTVCSPLAFRIHPLTVFAPSARETRSMWQAQDATQVRREEEDDARRSVQSFRIRTRQRREWIFKINEKLTVNVMIAVKFTSVIRDRSHGRKSVEYDPRNSNSKQEDLKSWRYVVRRKQYAVNISK